MTWLQLLTSVLVGFTLVFMVAMKLRPARDPSTVAIRTTKKKTSVKRDLKMYTVAEVAKHNERTDAWILVDGRVYDITSYVQFHPGGDSILANVGGDSTEAFYGPQHSGNPILVLDFYLIGFCTDYVETSGARAASMDRLKRDRTFTTDEVAKHKEAEDVWLIIDGKVYDCTELVNDHPGGAAALLRGAGKDVTAAWKAVHPPVAHSILRKYYIGDIKA